MDQLWQMTASEITRLVKSRQVSAIEVTRSYLDRLSDVNPTVDAVVDVCAEEALTDAQCIDEALSRNERSGALCAVPFTVKVNTDQRGHATTNGVRVLKTLIAQQDSPVVENIRKAGGIILGRTNTPAFSMRWFTDNALHGQTLNPRNTALTPGGSSGGAAAAVASGICAVGHGTDIAGSIRYPAYACGIHGLRPTLGRIPAHNASGSDRFIGAQIMAVSGPLARSIADLEIALHAMAEADARDPWYIPVPLGARDFPKRAALTVVPDGMVVDQAVQDALADAAAKLTDAGWRVEEVECPPMQHAADLNGCLWMAEIKLATKDMIEREGEPNALFVFEQMTKETESSNIDGPMHALQLRAGLVREWDIFLQKYSVLLCPVSGELPFQQQLDVESKESFARVFQAQLPLRALPTLGVPSLTVANGERDGRPCGVQLVSAKYREDILFAAGRDIETASEPIGVADPH
ncbi:MAG: amidase family protein [Pseudomonadota bacterium]